MEKMKIGIIGCGGISGAYFGGAQKTDVIEIKSCADVRMEAAKAAAERYGCQAVTVDELLADPEIELVVNLTIPKAHVEVGLRTLEAGKHAYSEKPMGVSTEEAYKLVELAKKKGLKVGCAPDTFLGAGGQTARKTLDEGAIGRPIAGTAFMCGHGHENWHHNPSFYYDLGGGPMLDMGPYYVTALVNILGPAKRVAGITTKAFEERIASSKGNEGLRIPVQVTTHLAGTIEFVNGAIVTMIMSFDIWRHSLPCIEIYGTEGSMRVPDPNGFGGPVTVAKPGDNWKEVPIEFPNNARTIGVIDMAIAIRTGRQHRVSGDLAYHVLEIMTAFDKSSQSGQHTEMKTKIERPAPFPTGLEEWKVD
ncbi:MAG: Gfo/Idh/MocA family oxidoreductase [Candidatus Poribacteria bacterium]